MAKRIGIYGGSFDPVHIGHLWIADAACESLSLDQVLWIPTATSPLKPSGPTASDEHRLQMLRLAVSGNPSFVVDDREIRRGDVSYTVDTIAQIRSEQPDDELVLIIGSDSLASFDRWHEPERLLDLVDLAVIQRGGDPKIDFGVLESLATPEKIRRAEQCVVPMPVIEISSGELRRRIGAGQSIRYRVPAAVAAMISAESIYRS
ncbi:Nicotinate-nucleotide adenylyltransferase [Rubripirellula lacrimiformis]|uniref:Probable nicotinate-nucleotide adenylyltransferase n=1 Tax=Rubripirellula lacrimiformis TaxID=1930273 RepID=A0A517N611_9BACT|nr:nicotinate (nicotinamide) nucleotide adenylyltransferase [Rubripirellula lacrimiformis]QDT02448.1 Nicotinate-nucleotide adenylyltransferase [Rubripirellula lacrimiformis]